MSYFAVTLPEQLSVIANMVSFDSAGSKCAFFTFTLSFSLRMLFVFVFLRLCYFSVPDRAFLRFANEVGSYSERLE